MNEEIIIQATRHWAKIFTYVISFNPHGSPRRGLLVLFLFADEETEMAEILRSLSKSHSRRCGQTVCEGERTKRERTKQEHTLARKG